MLQILDQMITFNMQVEGFILHGRTRLRSWIGEILSEHSEKAGNINFIFVDDREILRLNRQFLGHDYFTDIITFDTSGYRPSGTGGRVSAGISGDIYISVDTVSANAKDYSATFLLELYRVMAHGILHLLGYGDATPEETLKMRAAEDEAIALLTKFNIDA